MTNHIDILGRSSRRLEAYKKNDYAESKHEVDYTNSRKKHEVLKPKKAIVYYDSYVKNSHQYPNIRYIEPYNPLTVPSKTNLIQNINDYPMSIGSKFYTRQSIPKQQTFFV